MNILSLSSTLIIWHPNWKWILVTWCMIKMATNLQSVFTQRWYVQVHYLQKYKYPSRHAYIYIYTHPGWLLLNYVLWFVHILSNKAKQHSPSPTGTMLAVISLNVFQCNSKKQFAESCAKGRNKCKTTSKHVQYTHVYSVHKHILI